MRKVVGARGGLRSALRPHGFSGSAPLGCYGAQVGPHAKLSLCTPLACPPAGVAPVAPSPFQAHAPLPNTSGAPSNQDNGAGSSSAPPALPGPDINSDPVSWDQMLQRGGSSSSSKRDSKRKVALAAGRVSRGLHTGLLDLASLLEKGRLAQLRSRPAAEKDVSDLLLHLSASASSAPPSMPTTSGSAAQSEEGSGLSDLQVTGPPWWPARARKRDCRLCQTSLVLSNGSRRQPCSRCRCVLSSCLRKEGHHAPAFS